MKILIVEDEGIAARRLERLLREILSETALDISLCESFSLAEAALEADPPDVLMLDLNLAGQSGFDLLSRAVSYSFKTIIVSANTEQALRAFEYGVSDFVPKPVDRDRLEAALTRVTGGGASPSQQATKYLSVRSHGRIDLVDIDRLAYLQGAGDYVELHLKDGSMELHNKTLESLEQLLPKRFIRIHKSYIVDLQEIEKVLVHGAGKYETVLKNRTTLPMSRTRYKELLETRVLDAFKGE